MEIFANNLSPKTLGPKKFCFKKVLIKEDFGPKKFRL